MGSRLTLGLVLFLACTHVSGGQQQGTSYEGNLYQRALAASIDEMEKSWGKIDDSCCNGRIRTDYRHLIVEKTDVISDEWPSQFDNHRVEYLDAQGLIDRYRRLRKEFSILRVYSLRDRGGQLEIHISVYWIKAKKKKLFYGYSDWSVVTFQYDCERRAWDITEVKLGGI
jgi:hypothetical protein